jgi:hypothetical protein
MSDISGNSESLLTIVSAAEQPGFVTTSDPPKENAIDRRQLFRAAAPAAFSGLLHWALTCHERWLRS